jgi:hypothetical protein
MMQKRHFMDVRLAKHKPLLWTLAVIITIGSAAYQRRTGPTAAVRGKINLGSGPIKFKLLRTETVGRSVDISIEAPDVSISGVVQYRRFKSNDDWLMVPMVRSGSRLTAQLPPQPPAGKLVYLVSLSRAGRTVSLTEGNPVILRYKASVPIAVLLPHIVLIFLAMLYSNRAGLEAFDADGQAGRYMWIMFWLFILGGFLFGPLVQKYAFGQLWTGIPSGRDLTDNKMLIALAGWLVALIKNRGGRDGRGWIVIAAVFMLVIYLIPHSLLGSELDYTKMPPSP